MTVNNTQKEPKRKRIIFILLIIFVLLIAGGTGYYFWQNARLEGVRRELESPQVHIEHPAQGQHLVSDQFSYVSTQASGKNPIKSLELWIDGQLVEIISSELEDGSRQMGRVFDFLAEEGPHTIIVRATDINGTVGQSMPTSYTGDPPVSPDEVFVTSFYHPEIPLEILAEEFQVDPEQIVEMNPDVFGPGGSEEGPVIIPVNTDAEEADGEQPDAQPPAEVEFDSKALGKICYPGEKIPAMTAYFQNTKTNTVSSLPISANQTTYTVDLQPGTYTAYAWLTDKSLSGSYSKAVPCGLSVSCTDHTLLPFSVQAGSTTNGIDICDWYSNSSAPTPPQTPGGQAGPPSSSVLIPDGISMLPPDKLEPAGNNSSLPWAVFVPFWIPDAPTNLKAGVKDCKIQLSWDSDPADVSSYQVWYSAQNGLLKLMASLKAPSSGTKQHWYEFKAPSTGKVSVWVDAVNAIGSQSSNPATLTVPENCFSGSADNLVFSTMEVSTSTAYDRVYAYLSLEGIPEQRIPSDDSVFVHTEGGRGNISHFATGQNTYVLPLPKDESLTVEGECWGWSGGDLSQLSSFSKSIPASQWDGGTGSLGNEKCSIKYGIQANYSSGNTYETFCCKSGNIPAPFNVRVDRTKWADDTGWDLDDYDVYSWWFEREVFWQWKGDVKDISGFTILFNGQKLKTVPAKERKTIVQKSTGCGMDDKWEVVANGKDGTSPISQPFKEVKTAVKCGKYIKIDFNSIGWKKTCDESLICHWDYHQCDTFETYFTLSVNKFAKNFYGGNVFMPLKCGYHHFKHIAYQPKDKVFILPYGDGYESFVVKAKFYDYDPVSSDDYLGAPTYSWTWPSFKYGESYINDWYGSGGGEPFAFFQSRLGHNGSHYKGSEFDFWVKLYPNKVKQNP
jgi:hypothetical protein